MTLRRALKRLRLKPGDVITHINGQPIHNGADLVNPIADTPIGQSVQVRYVRDKQAKDANTLNGQKWNDFRKAQCGADAAATPAAAPAAPAAEAKPAETKPAAAMERATPTSPWHPTSAPEMEAFSLYSTPMAAAARK